MGHKPLYDQYQYSDNLLHFLLENLTRLCTVNRKSRPAFQFRSRLVEIEERNFSLCTAIICVNENYMYINGKQVTYNKLNFLNKNCLHQISLELSTEAISWDK